MLEFVPDVLFQVNDSAAEGLNDSRVVAFKYLFPDFFIAEKVCFFGHHVLLHAVVLIDADGKFGRIPLAEAGLRQRAVFFIMVPEVTERPPVSFFPFFDELRPGVLGLAAFAPCAGRVILVTQKFGFIFSVPPAFPGDAFREHFPIDFLFLWRHHFEPCLELFCISSAEACPPADG